MPIKFLIIHAKWQMIGEPTSDFAVQDEGNIIYMCTMLGYFMLQRFGLWELGPWRLHWVPSPVPWKSSDLNCWHGPWLVHDVALNYRPLHTRDWVPMTNYTSSTLIVKIIIKKFKKNRSRCKFPSHYAWGTNRVCECKMDKKSTWIPTWHQMDHGLYSLGLFPKTTSWR